MKNNLIVNFFNTKSDSSAPKKKYLEDIVLLRLLLIFLLIWNHAFAPYSGKWDAIPNIENIAVYKWLVLIVYHMRIQALIFISGYLLGYTSMRKPDALLFKNCVVKKIKRLLLPCIIFSIIYYVIFYDITRPLNQIAYTIINGAGHMWFLPMLFWCFCGVWLAEKFKISPKLILAISVICAIIPTPTIPLRINMTLKYFIFFYMGFGIKKNYFEFLFPKNKLKPIIVAILIYFTAFLINYILIADNIKDLTVSSNEIFNKILQITINHSLSLMMSVSGLFAAFWSAHYFIIGKYKLPDWMINLSTFCYGIYICHQFILVYLYYHTPFPYICGGIALPWIAIIITLFLSIIITYLLLHTKFGRYLIG